MNRSLILHGYRPFDLKYHESGNGQNADGGGNTGKIVFNSQEDLDRMIEKRLTRQKESLRKDEEFVGEIRAEIEGEQTAEQLKEHGKYKDMYDAEVVKVGKLQEKIDELKGQIAERELSDLRKKIAADNKLPDELADRLKGETEEEITADAKELAKKLKVEEKSEEEKQPITSANRRKPVDTDAGKTSPLRPTPIDKPDSEGNQNSRKSSPYAFVKEGDVSWG